MPQMRVLMVCGRQAVLRRRRTASQRGGPHSRGMRAVSTTEGGFPRIVSRGQKNRFACGRTRYRTVQRCLPLRT
jgi:hypothetical protein